MGIVMVLAMLTSATTNAAKAGRNGKESSSNGVWLPVEPERGTSTPTRSIASLKSWQSSPVLIAW